jgi:hypothetical protein
VAPTSRPPSPRLPKCPPCFLVVALFQNSGICVACVRRVRFLCSSNFLSLSFVCPSPAMFSGKYRMEADEDGCYFIGMFCLIRTPLIYFPFPQLFVQTRKTNQPTGARHGLHFTLSLLAHHPIPHTTAQTGIRRIFATCSTFSGTRASRYASPLVWVSCRVVLCGGVVYRAMVWQSMVTTMICPSGFRATGLTRRKPDLGC